MQNFSVQGLSDTLTALDTELTVIQPLSKEYALLLEVTMADCLGHWHPPTFSWNAGMVIHVLKDDPTLRDLEYVQVDGPGTVYLFFFDKQGCKGLHSRPLKPSGTMWGRRLLSGSPTLHTLLSFSFHWWKGGARQLPHQNGAARYLDQSIKIAP